MSFFRFQNGGMGVRSIGSRRAAAEWAAAGGITSVARENLLRRATKTGRSAARVTARSFDQIFVYLLSRDNKTSKVRVASKL